MQSMGDQLMMIPIKTLSNPQHDNEDGLMNAQDAQDAGESLGLRRGKYVQDTEALLPQKFVLQKNIKELKQEIFVALADNNRYMNTINANIKHIYMKPVAQTKATLKVRRLQLLTC